MDVMQSNLSKIGDLTNSRLHQFPVHGRCLRTTSYNLCLQALMPQLPFPFPPWSFHSQPVPLWPIQLGSVHRLFLYTQILTCKCFTTLAKFYWKCQTFNKEDGDKAQNRTYGSPRAGSHCWWPEQSHQQTKQEFAREAERMSHFSYQAPH